MMKKVVAFLMAMVMATMMLAACSSKPAPEKATDTVDDVEISDKQADDDEAKDVEPSKDIKIGVAFATELLARFEFDEMFMQETADRLGAELLVQWANYDQTTQENQVENLITQGIDVLILIGVSSNMSPLVEKVKEEGIPVVCYDNFIVDAPIDAYLDRDNEEAGRIQMQAAIDAIGGAGDIAILHGEPTSSVVHGMEVGYNEILAKYPDVNVVVEQYHEGYSAEKALNTAENALSKHNNKIDAFVCTADILALGILPAVEAAGVLGEVYITGMDCEVPTMQAINKGSIGISIWTEIDKCAIEAVEIAYALATGQDFEYDEMVTNGDYQVPKLYVPVAGITKDNLEDWVENIAPKGWITMEQILSETE